MERDRRYWIRLLRFAGIALLVGLVTAYVGSAVVPGAIYAHHLTHPGCGDAGGTPAEMGIKGTLDVTTLSHDGLTLRAWYLPPQNGAVIVLLPGWGGARDGMLHEGAVLARHGYGLLMTELRSCAHPDGTSTLGYYEARDLSNAANWARGQPGVEHVGVLGFSLGGVTAVMGAAEDVQIEAVVAEGGFYDLAADIVNEGSRNTLWETIMFQAILFSFRRETGIAAHDVSPISVIDRISPRPLLLIYGEHERAETRPEEQWAQAKEPKDLWIVPGCGHGGYPLVAPEEWERRVVGSFDDAFDLNAP